MRKGGSTKWFLGDFLYLGRVGDHTKNYSTLYIRDIHIVLALGFRKRKHFPTSSFPNQSREN